MDNQSLTSFERLKNYRNALPEILAQLEPDIKLAAEKCKATGQEYHRIVLVEHDGHQYCCSVFHSSYESHCMVYLLIPRKNCFEAFGYDKERDRYHHYHDNFFRRYAQRMSLTTKSHFDIFKHYLEHNPVLVHSGYFKKFERMQYFHAIVRTGNIYGYFDSQYRILNFRMLTEHYTLTGKRKKNSGYFVNKSGQLEHSRR